MDIWWNMGLAPTHKRAKSVILLPWMWKMMLNCEFWRPRRWYTDDHGRICLFNTPNNIEKNGKITGNHIITGQICCPDSCMVEPLSALNLQEVDHQSFAWPARDRAISGTGGSVLKIPSPIWKTAPSWLMSQVLNGNVSTLKLRYIYIYINHI